MEKSVLFEVTEKPIFVDNEQVPSRKAIVNEDTNDVIGIVGKSYVPVSNKSILKHFTQIIDNSGLSYEVTKGHLIRGGSRTIMEIQFPELTIDAGKDDPLIFRAYLINSFDGHSSAKMVAGFIRLVCENGMTVGDEELIIAYRHIGNVNDKLVAEFKLYLNNKLQSFQAFIEGLKELTFKRSEQVQYIIENCEWIAKKYKQDLLDEWQKKKEILNAWMLYNVFTFVITHKIKQNIDGKLKLLKQLNLASRKWGIP